MGNPLGFVILHYNTEIETINCVESIIRYVDNPIIVVVDNGSSNGSGERLVYRYLNSCVTVLCLRENLGFANGNNTGIKYLLNNTSLKFITVINNDTIILKEGFEKCVFDEYKLSHYAVMGPMVITKDGETNSNPVESVVKTKYEAKKLITKRRIKLFLNEVHMNWMVNDVGKGTIKGTLYDSSQRYENVKLHGCCWIFSPKYFEHFWGLCGKTFLYFEEDILFNSMMKIGLKTVYNPEIKIMHLEDAATNSIVRIPREKNIFVLKNEINSLKVLTKLL